MIPLLPSNILIHSSPFPSYHIHTTKRSLWPTKVCSSLLLSELYHRSPVTSIKVWVSSAASSSPSSALYFGDQVLATTSHLVYFHSLLKVLLPTASAHESYSAQTIRVIFPNIIMSLPCLKLKWFLNALNYCPKSFKCFIRSSRSAHDYFTSYIYGLGPLPLSYALNHLYFLELLLMIQISMSLSMWYLIDTFPSYSG